MDQFLLIVVLQQALLAISLYLPMMGGQLSLASPAFFAIGGYLAALFSTRYAAGFFAWQSDNYPWFLGLGEMLAAGLLCYVLAWGVGRLALRLRGIYLALATVALVEIVRVVCLNIEWTGGAIGIFSIPQLLSDQKNYLFWFLPLFIVVLFVVLRLELSSEGRALRALREDDYAAAALGIDPVRYRAQVFAIGAALAGTTGALSAHLLNTWNARQGTFDSSINLLAYVIIGGPWTVLG
ncbi:MAG: branched-chain amino acid ABC transporter permease, partial [Proteobacteria bacterium]|nr:branched-chain amino acid ABC transporter permease [Pseudomonadota bacterium]